MGLQIFEIEFDNQTKTYFSSQVVLGRVIVQIDHQEKRISELVLRLWGKAEVNWVDSKGKQKRTPRPKTSATPEIRISHSRDPVPHASNSNEKVFASEESYFDRRYTILEKSGAEDIVIQPGRNSYPFEIVLPSGIPSSFEGEHGSVKYFLEATMKRTAVGFDHSFRTQIYIKGILDLNFDPHAQIVRQEMSQEEYLSCLCCKNGPIGFNFGILGNSGVIPGESMEFLADIYNMSDEREVSIKLKLIQITTYHAKPEFKIVRKDLLKLKGPTVLRGGTGSWTDSIIIPGGIPPTRLAGRSTLMSVEYSVEITLETSRGKKITAQITIVIGTIPFGAKVEDVLSLAATSASCNTPSTLTKNTTANNENHETSQIKNNENNGSS